MNECKDFAQPLGPREIYTHPWVQLGTTSNCYNYAKTHVYICNVMYYKNQKRNLKHYMEYLYNYATNTTRNA